MVSSTSALLRLYRSNTAPPADPPSRDLGTLRSMAPIEVMSRRRYVPLRLSTRWACRSHFLAPTRARISSSRTTSKATRIAPWQSVRRSVRKFSCVGSSSSATSFTGSSLDSPASETVGFWLPKSFHFLFSLRELPIHTDTTRSDHPCGHRPRSSSGHPGTDHARADPLPFRVEARGGQVQQVDGREADQAGLGDRRGDQDR